MLDLARALPARDGLTNAAFLHADAQVHDLGESRFDLAVSRHGTMFFGDRGAAFGFVADHFASTFDQLDDGPRARALDDLRADVADHLTDRGVLYGAAHWLVRARRA